jgi:hypothetical protein
MSFHIGCCCSDKKLSSKKWLAKHGLAAKKLTIIDLLAPTFISHEPRFVPALNKEVLSKVFDEVCMSYKSFLGVLLLSSLIIKFNVDLP